MPPPKPPCDPRATPWFSGPITAGGVISTVWQVILTVKCRTRSAVSSDDLTPGNKVAIPWGLDEIVGIVVEIYGPPARRSVLVRVPTHGPSGETLDESE